MDIDNIISDVEHLITSRQLVLAKVKKDYTNSVDETNELFSIAATLITETIDSLSEIRTALLEFKGEQNV